MDSIQFQDWANRLGLSEETINEIQRVRQRAPARRVGGGKKNVSGRYSSRKMGYTIQFESHKVELPTIYELEFNDDVLEYYDQPTKIKIFYEKNNKEHAYWKTADFFVIEKDRAYWLECKVEEELIKQSQKNPNRYYKKDGNWIFAPGKTYAVRLELDFFVKSSASINWTFHRNIDFLRDYLLNKHDVDKETIKDIKQLVLATPTLSLDVLLNTSRFKADDIYALIANRTIYIDLYTDLIVESNNVKVYLNSEQFKSISNVKSNITSKNITNIIDLKIGNKILWGDITWQIININNANSLIFLYCKKTKKSVEIPIQIFEGYISNGYIKGINESVPIADLTMKISGASERDLKIANEKYEIVSRYLKGEEITNLNVTDRTLRNWLKKFKEAEDIHGNGFIGLLPQIKRRGNREDKLPSETKDLMNEIITNSFETIKLKSAKAVYRELLVKCDRLKLIPPSYQSFCKAIKSRPIHEVVKARQGERAAYKNEEFYMYLDFTTPKHGDRVFEIAHIDHTELDIELLVDGKNSIRPWLTLMVDAYSRRILAFYLTFEEPSYRSCMMVIRECVKNHNRLPNYIVVDGGKEFGSVYFESLLAMYGVHKKQRPPAKSRFGNVVERLFGISNQLLIHNLLGNTQVTKNVRQVTKSVNPKNHAVWRFEAFYELFQGWVTNVYDNMENPSLHSTPKEVFEESLLLSGERLNTYIPYDDTFILMTLPSPKGKTRKVHPGQGFKLTYSYYWCEEFRNPKIENTSVYVRFDPFNIGIAYAYINGTWIKCISEQYKYLVNKTEKQIKIITDEIRKKNKILSQNNTITARMIANYILETEEIEEQLVKGKISIEGYNVQSDEKEILDEKNQNSNQNDLDLNELEIFRELK